MWYKKKYTARDIVNIMQEMGMRRGSVVCIHSSMKEFYNYVGTPVELIDTIIEVIGAEGTLIMPAFPLKSLISVPDYVFDSKKDMTGAGLLAETFRKYPNVQRSINVQHSVCAWGKLANYLLKNHQYCDNCWDINSPWYKMCQYNCLVFNLGMPRSYIGTFYHCVESLLREEHPYWAQFFNTTKQYRYYDSQEQVCEYSCKTSTLTRRTREKRVTRYFTPEDWQIRKISNLEIKVFYSKHCLEKMLDLGRKGVSVYYEPSPFKYKF